MLASLSIRNLCASLLARFVRDQKGAITVVSAIAIPVLIGVTGLVAELGHGLLTKSENQRIADLAAYAGALAYNSTSSSTNMTAAAQRVATMNGIPSSAVSATLVTSPRDSSSQAVLVNISTSNLVLLAPVTKTTASLTIGASSYAQLGAKTDPCIIALNASGTGVTLSGGTSVTASACAVASNNTVTVPCGTRITAKIVNYNSSAAPSQPCSGITANSVSKATTTDPLAANTGVTTAVARVATVAALTSPTAPAAPSSVTGKPIDFAYNASSTQAQATAIGCTATVSGSTWTLTCPSGGTYNFSALTIGGGINLNFNTSGSALNVYNFSQSLSTSATTAFGPGTYNFAQNVTTNGTTTFGAGTYNIGGAFTAGGGATTTFGAGTFNITGGITTGGGTTTTFGAGTFNIGRSASACSGGGMYSICNTSTLTFGGPSTFNLTAGLYNSGGSTLTLGSGTTNSFNIGGSSDGNAVYAGGGSKTIFADATGSSNVFSLNGNFNVASGGGSCMTISAAAQHDIDGFFTTAGGTILGAGVYTVNGYIGLGANGGGDVTCSGSTVGMNGTGVTLVTSGASTMSSGSCSGLSFCIAAGYNNVTLTAPAAGATAALVVIGPASATAGAALTEGASNTSVSGAFYFPKGPISLSGGASIGNGTGQCLTLIGTQISLSGGTTAASTCISSAGSSSSSVSLVQ